MRQVVLDTETTGLEPEQGHRIIEIGAVEIIDRRPTGRHFHRYLNPERDIDPGALEVHGITLDFLADKPRFADVVGEFLAFVSGAELVIHNAPFDVSFLEYELSLLDDGGVRRMAEVCTVVDSLAMARHKHPGQKNSLDALCRRYGVDNSERELHGALLDAEILSEVYLAMTGGQTALFGGDQDQGDDGTAVVSTADVLRSDRPRLRIVRATFEEAAAHEARLDELDRRCRGGSVWRRNIGPTSTS
jgi:DNA polymerase-3 subunit epsilon